MLKKLSLIDVGLIGILGLLLCFPNECISAGKDGLLLWFNVIIPTLFPFILISYIIVNSPILDIINRLFTPIISKILHLPGCAAYAFIMGSISGYPMGAKVISDLMEQKKATYSEGQYMLSFCNNASPMFVIGFICSQLLDKTNLALPMFLTIHLGNIITLIVTRKFYHLKHTSNATYKISKLKPFTFSYFDQCISSTAEILVKVGGYIIFFSLPMTLLTTLPINNVLFQFSISTIELSNGCALLANLSNNLELKYALLSSLAAFGSFSVIGQTASVIKKSRLSMKKYLFAKTINAVITFITAFIIINLLS